VSQNTAIGSNTNAIGNNSINTATGTFADAHGDNGQNVANGDQTNASGASGRNVATGSFADAHGDNSDNVADGNQANASGAISANTAVGNNADAHGDNGFNSALGLGARASGNNSTNTALGTNSQALGSGSSNVAIGSLADAHGDNEHNTAVGANSVATGNGSAAFGAGAQAAFVNSAAFGAGATVVRDNQQVFGTASNTYRLPGLPSAASASAQSGPTQVVTTDAFGNLGTTQITGLGFPSAAASVVDLSTLNNRIDALSRKIRKGYTGVAMGFAMAGVPTVLPNEKAAFTVNWGTFQGENGAALIGAVRIYHNLQFQGGFSYGFRKNMAGGHAGLRIGF
jgi:trimeric autotransporter adhesin